MDYSVYAKVEIYDDNKFSQETSVFYADSFTDAMRRLEDYYGNCLSNVLHLELFDSGLIILNDEDTAKAVYKEMNWMCE